MSTPDKRSYENNKGKYSALKYFSRLDNIIYKLELFEICNKSIDVLNTY